LGTDCFAPENAVYIILKLANKIPSLLHNTGENETMASFENVLLL
jgi:hypothetical protein